MGAIEKPTTSNLSSPTLLVRGSNESQTANEDGSTEPLDPYQEIRMAVWFLASELYRLNDLQHFAETVEESDPVDIKRTAQILARAQMELRGLANSRNTGPTSRISAVITKI